MPNFDQTGPRGQGQTGKGLGRCRSNTNTGNKGDNCFSEGMGRRTRGCFDKGQGLGRCGGRQGQGQSRKRGQGRR
jgi:hypothetical protein